MSHNLEIARIGCPWQTDSETTKRLLANLSPGTVLEQDIQVIERLRTWAHETTDPPPLFGTDARNPHLLEWRQQQIAEIDEMIDSTIARMRELNSRHRLTCSN
jgi:hypothetical protein